MQCLSEGIISHSVQIPLKIFFESHSDLLKAFQVNLKEHLGLILPKHRHDKDVSMVFG